MDFVNLILGGQKVYFGFTFKTYDSLGKLKPRFFFIFRVKLFWYLINSYLEIKILLKKNPLSLLNSFLIKKVHYVP